MQQVKTTVKSNRELLSYPGAKYYLMQIKAPEIAEASRPGQFLMVKCGNTVLLRRPLSVHSVTKSGEVHLLFAVPDMLAKENTLKLDRVSETPFNKGKGTLWLSELRKQDELNLVGPLGNGFSIDSKAQNLLLVAGGIGIAPLKFLAQKALEQKKSIRLLIGARSKSGIYPQELLPAGATSVFSTEDGSFGRKAKVTELIPEHINWADQVFACGPEAMYQEINVQFDKLKIEEPIQVSLEVRMGCGIGACYGCGINTRRGMERVCKDGPVFNISDIIWQEVRK